MTAILKEDQEVYVDHVKPRHSTQSQRLRTLMDEAADIRVRYERGEIEVEEAVRLLSELKDRHRTLFQRVLGL